MLQLRDPELAEDVVQETLLAALEGLAGFAGKSSHQTWLTGILKHKIIDAMRRKMREQPLTSSDGESDADAIDALFKEDGHWQQFSRAARLYSRCRATLPRRRQPALIDAPASARGHRRTRAPRHRP